MSQPGRCALHTGALATTGAQSNSHWWPNQLNLAILHQHPPASDPMGAGCDYAAEFGTLDLDAVVRDLHALMTDSQDWWPADWGHYDGGGVLAVQAPVRAAGGDAQSGDRGAAAPR